MAGLAAVSIVCLGAPVQAAPVAGRVVVGDAAAAARSAAKPLGYLASASPVTAALTLPLRRQAALSEFLRRVSDPADPAYGRFLSPQEFAEQFGPTQADYDALACYAQAQGLIVTGTHASRRLLDVSGPASCFEAAFQVHLSRYKAADGRVFRAPDAAPSVSPSAAGVVFGVVGLSTAAVRRPHLRRPAAFQAAPRVGSGPQGGLSPSDIRTAYSLGGVSQTGSGQTLALFELDGFSSADITAYQSYFGLSFTPVQTILVDSANGTAGAGADEVTLDIELQAALAPGASRILVYETGTTDPEVLDGYTRIADDDSAKQISTSWGLDEPDTDPATMRSENAIFQQMAAQGQTLYAAGGDNGAYDTGLSRDGISVDDPASQPYVCGVGGTTLTTMGAGGGYFSETTWNSGSAAYGAGGGGVSTVWPIPSWQRSAAASSSSRLVSTAMRNVPDVSLNADPNTGYAIYYGGAWNVYGGTSAAAPLWAGFTALVNQQRTLNGLSPLGQASPALYPLLTTARYAADFHDIADGSTNLYYPTTAGYDDATGLGTLNGAALLTDLAGTPPAAAPTTHVLWNNVNGTASIWNYNTAAGTFTQTTYGPYPGWTAAAIADGGTDGLSRVLWDNTNGTASLWSLNSALGQFTQFSFGPYAGWTATALSVAADNTTHVLWNNVNGAASLWNYSTASGMFTQHTYGPYPGWTAAAIADGGTDGLSRVLWDNSDGRMSLWSLSNSAGQFTQHTFGPYPGWTAAALSVGAGNTTHILWTNTSGQVSLWNYSAAAGTFTQNTYGPYSGWAARGLADGADGKTRVLWDNTSGTASLWSLDNTTGVFSQFTFGPYSGWTAAALSGT